VSSRQEQKEARRQERLAREAEEAKKASRNRRLQIVGGVVIGVVAVVAVVVAVVAGTGGGDDKDAPKPSGKKNPQVAAVPIPARKTAELFAAAKAAGCTVKTFPNEGREHITTAGTYKTNPPTSGNHSPVPADDGDYSGRQTPAKENYVHTLEHGRIEFQYRPGTPSKVIGQMRTLFNEGGAYHSVLFENNTEMPYEVAATAWTHLIGCPKVDNKTWDALRAFRVRYVDQAPEQIP
jgi:Protein of unknown function (DUF3105)